MSRLPDLYSGRTKPPCSGCGERRAGCQAACEGYARYKAALEEEKAVIRDYGIRHDLTEDYSLENQKR